jgi:hypothetical protein
MILNNCTVSDNSSGTGSEGFIGGNNGGSGGGIYNTGMMLLNNCTVTSNSTGVGGDSGGPIQGWAGEPGGGGGDGGGICNIGKLAVRHSTINGNSCGAGGKGGAAQHPYSQGHGGDGGSGGGIFNANVLTMDACIVTGNSCGAGGIGGVYSVVINAGNDYPPTIVANGGAGGSGGGIVNMADGSHAKLFNTLVTLNFFGDGGVGGDVYYPPFPNPVQAGSGPDGSGPNLFGNFTIFGH